MTANIVQARGNEGIMSRLGSPCKGPVATTEKLAKRQGPWQQGGQDSGPMGLVIRHEFLSFLHHYFWF